MKTMKSYVAAAVIALTALLSSPAAWATRDQTLAQLLNSTNHQGSFVYYNTLGVVYNNSTYKSYAYTNAYNTYVDLIYAWYYAPIGSGMEAYAKTAYQLQYYAYLYSVYSYVYGSSYATTASLYADYAMWYAGLSQYYAAYNA
ncbi:hypothetical protein [uncultured Thiodictyon sp.]|uniref:hypothetical protein n=1 Tax=uncultured Thiodictyon sp. TaxID=1846217 RepID=UPI0025FC2AEE|nr:hypothetical protein [uncultured Thiodictyon sp.]